MQLTIQWRDVASEFAASSACSALLRVSAVYLVSLLLPQERLRYAVPSKYRLQPTVTKLK